MRTSAAVLPHAFVLAALAVLLTTAPTHAQARDAPRCFSESDTVSLNGTLVRRRYPGAPNYESIRDGDEPETGFYVELRRPICTRAWTNSEAREDVRLVQLVLDSAGYDRLRPLVGRRTAVRGVLYASFSGHHHAPLLLNVTATSGAQRSGRGAQRMERRPALAHSPVPAAPFRR